MNGTSSYDDFKNEKNNLSNNGFRFYINAGFQQTFPWELRLSLYGGGSSSSVGLQGKDSGYSYYSINLNRAFLDKRLTISIYARNPFNKDQKYHSTIETTDFHSYSESTYPQRSFGFNISYRIGELKANVKKAARSIENDDVKSGGDSKGTQGSN